MKKIATVIVVIILALSAGTAQSPSAKEQGDPGARQTADKRHVGFYSVMAEAESVKALPPATIDQQVIRYDYGFLRTTERDKPRYFLLSRFPDVELMLSKTPELQEEGENGFPELHLELTSESARNLEQLTRDHLGGKVVFMIDGAPVTVHKIRSVITGGQFRLSRCTDTACQYIYGRLMEER